MMHRKLSKDDAVFGIAALLLLIVFAAYAAYGVAFVARTVDATLGELPPAGPLLVHFDFATLNQAILGKAPPAQVP